MQLFKEVRWILNLMIKIVFVIEVNSRSPLKQCVGKGTISAVVCKPETQTEYRAVEIVKSPLHITLS